MLFIHDAIGKHDKKYVLICDAPHEFAAEGMFALAEKSDLWEVKLIGLMRKGDFMQKIPVNGFYEKTFDWFGFVMAIMAVVLVFVTVIVLIYGVFTRV